MGLADIALVGLGALAGGFVSGLTGFGTGITAMGFWLYALPLQVASSLRALLAAPGPGPGFSANWATATTTGSSRSCCIYPVFHSW